jgi:hypothetical protein
VRLPWTGDGRSLLEKWAGPTSVGVGKVDGTFVRASQGEMERGMEATLHRKAVFGSTWDSLLATGLPRHLVGLEVGSLPEPAAAGAHVRFDNEELFAHVDMSSSFVPARITGTVEGIRIPSDRALAVAVNGRVAAATRCFRVKGEQRFSALVPEAVFRDGFNRVELLAIEGTPSAPRLIQIGQNGEAQRS